MKRGKPKTDEPQQSGNVERDMSKELSTEEPTAKSTERIRDDPADLFATEIEANGFI